MRLRGRIAGVAASVGLAVVIAVAAAQAARSPSLAERVEITRALPAWLRKYPVGCVRLRTVVSANGRYAEVTPEYLVKQGAAADPCIRYAANGYFVLQKRLKWRVVGSLSEPPPCSWKVPRDLAPTCAR